MIIEPMDALLHHEVRKTKAQKTSFLLSAVSFFRQCGYEPIVETDKQKNRNLVAGNPETAKYLITAHYDTPAQMLLPNFITPCSLPLYLLWQLLIIGVFWIISAIPAIPFLLMEGGEVLAFAVWYVAYFALLALIRYGRANRHNANDNTSGVVTVMEIARSMPQKLRSQVCFVLFDREELGLKGSAAYRKRHKEATEHQLVLNLDCVGDGDEILFFPKKKLCKEDALITSLKTCEGRFGEKGITVRDKGFSVYPSDQRNFPKGVAIAAMRKGRLALYMGRIHTSRDTVLDITNVNILRAALISFISADAAKYERNEKNETL